MQQKFAIKCADMNMFLSGIYSEYDVPEVLLTQSKKNAMLFDSVVESKEWTNKIRWILRKHYDKDYQFDIVLVTMGHPSDNSEPFKEEFTWYSSTEE